MFASLTYFSGAALKGRLLALLANIRIGEKALP